MSNKVKKQKQRRKDKEKKSRSRRRALPPPITPEMEDEDIDYDDDGMDYEEKEVKKRFTKLGRPIITSSDGGRYNPSLMKSYHDQRISGQHEDEEEGNEKWEQDQQQEKGPNEIVPEIIRKRTKSTVILKEAPSAKESAYAGPPRYDWIDIETSAAIKVQSVYRRNKVLKMLEENGMETTGMKNRKKLRKSRWRSGVVSDDVPWIFSFCGVGFLFGDATMEAEKDVHMQRNNINYLEKRHQKLEREERQRQYRLRQRPHEQIAEGFEVVDNLKSRENIRG